MSVASWALVAHDHAAAENRRAARIYLGFAGFGGLCLVLAFGVLAGGAGDVATSPLLREAPPQGARAAAVLALVLAGAGSKAGIVPLHVWLPLAHPAAPSHVSAVMSGAMTKVALYVLARFVFDLMGPAQPFWLGAPLMAFGAASAVIGALRANLEDDTKVLLACSTIENVGLIVMAFGAGAGLSRRRPAGAGRPRRLRAALLHTLNHAVFKTLLFLVAGEVLHGALSRQLDRLGGLIHRMPVTAWAALVGVAAAASLPPLSGFASEWLLLQALLAAWRVGDIGVPDGGRGRHGAGGAGGGAGGGGDGAVLGAGLPRQAAHPTGGRGAEESGGLAQAALLVPAGLTVLLGLAPGAMLALADPALRLMVGTAVAAGRGGSRSAPPRAARGYWPLPVALLLAGAVVAGGSGLCGAARRPASVRRPGLGLRLHRRAAALPLRRPAAQPSAAGFGQPLRRMLGTGLLGAHEAVDHAGAGRDPRGRSAGRLRRPRRFPRWKARCRAGATALPCRPSACVACRSANASG